MAYRAVLFVDFRAAQIALLLSNHRGCRDFLSLDARVQSHMRKFLLK